MKKTDPKSPAKTFPNPEDEARLDPGDVLQSREQAFKLQFWLEKGWHWI